MCCNSGLLKVCSKPPCTYLQLTEMLQGPYMQENRVALLVLSIQGQSSDSESTPGSQRRGPYLPLLTPRFQQITGGSAEAVLTPLSQPDARDTHPPAGTHHLLSPGENRTKHPGAQQVCWNMNKLCCYTHPRQCHFNPSPSFWHIS